MAITDTDLAWFAGIVEGEGTFSSQGRHGSRRRPEIAVSMTDEDVIRRCHRITGVGGVSRYETGFKPMFRWRVTKVVRIATATKIRVAASERSEPRASPQIVRSGETSLEGMVRDLLRPALTEWLDKNLPPLVERLVASEIARIVGKRG